MKGGVVKQFFYYSLFCLGTVTFLCNSFWYYQGIHAVEPYSVKEEATLTNRDLSPSVIKARIKSQINPLQRLYPHGKPTIGEQYGKLNIPRLKTSIPIFYGIHEDQLKKGIGHIERTALPGENNNTILSGHRDTVFRQLGNLSIGDELIIETKEEQFIYKIKKIRIVSHTDRSIIVPKPGPTLTLITCYPFWFLGHAPKRYVIIADLISPNDLVRYYRSQH